jgi:hypothetical protein
MSDLLQESDATQDFQVISKLKIFFLQFFFFFLA